MSGEAVGERRWDALVIGGGIAGLTAAWDLVRAGLRPLRTGASRTGPTPSSIRTPTPARRSGTMMSEKKTAASTPWRRTGCSVTSAASAGSSPARARSARYSGSDRPA